jgi:hypothetical protein
MAAARAKAKAKEDRERLAAQQLRTAALSQESGPVTFTNVSSETNAAGQSQYMLLLYNCTLFARDDN